MRITKSIMVFQKNQTLRPKWRGARAITQRVKHSQNNSEGGRYSDFCRRQYMNSTTRLRESSAPVERWLFRWDHQMAPGWKRKLRYFISGLNIFNIFWIGSTLMIPTAPEEIPDLPIQPEFDNLTSILDEAQQAICSLKNRKSPGDVEIPGEIYMKWRASPYILSSRSRILLRCLLFPVVKLIIPEWISIRKKEF